MVTYHVAAGLQPAHKCAPETFRHAAAFGRLLRRLAVARQKVEDSFRSWSSEWSSTHPLRSHDSINNLKNTNKADLAKSLKKGYSQKGYGIMYKDRELETAREILNTEETTKIVHTTSTEKIELTLDLTQRIGSVPFVGE